MTQSLIFISTTYLWAHNVAGTEQGCEHSF